MGGAEATDWRSVDSSSSLLILFLKMNGVDFILSLSLCKSYTVEILDSELDCLGSRLGSWGDVMN